MTWKERREARRDEKPALELARSAPGHPAHPCVILHLKGGGKTASCEVPLDTIPQLIEALKQGYQYLSGEGGKDG